MISAFSDDDIVAAIWSAFPRLEHDEHQDAGELTITAGDRVATLSPVEPSSTSARRVTRTARLRAGDDGHQSALLAIQILGSLPPLRVRGCVADDDAALVDSVLRSLFEEPDSDRTSEQRQRGLEELALCFVRPRMGGGPFTPEEHAMAAHNRRAGEARDAIRQGLIPSLG